MNIILCVESYDFKIYKLNFIIILLKALLYCIFVNYPVTFMISIIKQAAVHHHSAATSKLLLDRLNSAIYY